MADIEIRALQPRQIAVAAFNNGGRPTTAEHKRDRLFVDTLNDNFTNVGEVLASIQDVLTQLQAVGEQQTQILTGVQGVQSAQTDILNDISSVENSQTSILDKQNTLLINVNTAVQNTNTLVSNMQTTLGQIGLLSLGIADAIVKIQTVIDNLQTFNQFVSNEILAQTLWRNEYGPKIDTILAQTA